MKDLDCKRTLAEARRLFYVVATRARETLVLTGVGKSSETVGERSSFKAPLSALLDIRSGGDHSLPHVALFENPEPPGDLQIEAVKLSPELIPPPFEAAPLPYHIGSPSRVEDETLQAAPLGSEGEDVYARARGLVIHRLLETLCRRRPLPDLHAVVLALSAEGIPLKEAKEKAPGVLIEASRAWNLEEFEALRRGAREIHPEWAVEDFDGEKMLRVGRFDLLLKTERSWLILDYKTGQPGNDVDSWAAAQVNHYRSQLGAYAQMVAKALDVAEETIEWGILLTALPRLVYGSA